MRAGKCSKCLYNVSYIHQHFLQSRASLTLTCKYQSADRLAYI